MEQSFRRAISLVTGLVLVGVLTLTLTSQAGASSGIWDRAWGKNVNGGDIFGICPVASNCLKGTVGGFGGEMFFPLGIAADGSGNVYVTDGLDNRVQKFDASGTWERAWGRNVIQSGKPGDLGSGFEVCTVAADCQAGTAGTLGGEMSDPEGVAADAAGNVYVGDSGNNRIQKFDSSGAFLRAWGKNVNGGDIFGICPVASNCLKGTVGGFGGEMSHPEGVAADGAGNVYVTEIGNTRIQKFDSAGVFLRAWGKNVNGGGVFGVCTAPASCFAGAIGTMGGEMSTPVGIAADGGGKVYLADLGNSRIQKFDSSGGWERAWGKNVNGGGVFEVCTLASTCLAGDTGTFGGEMTSPVGVAADGAGNVYVSDSEDSRIQEFSSLGAFLRAWGKNVNGGGVFGVCTVASSCLAGDTGTFGGEMDSPNSNSIAADASGNVYISDTNNSRVQRFADPIPSPAVTTPAQVTPPSPTGQRARAIRKCKKRFPKGPLRTKCIRKAKRLPV